MKGKIVLAGGGEAEDSLPLDKQFAGWIKPHGKVLYWPIALKGLRSFDLSLEWFISTYNPLGLKNIQMWTGLTGHHPAELGAFDAIYIGGGNTYSLLAQLKESGFDRHLPRYVSAGGIVYGGSAGAAILGRDIRTVSHLDRNEVGLTSLDGLDLASGYSIWVHYQSENDSLIREYIKETGIPVIGISERAGVVMDSIGSYSVGYDAAWVFDDTSKHALHQQQNPLIS